MKTILSSLLLIVLLSCGGTTVEPQSTIECKISIGPLCGTVTVEEASGSKNGNPCGFSDAKLDEIYGKYSVTLKDSSNKLLKQSKLTHTGIVSFEVEEGTYTINVESSVSTIRGLGNQTQIFSIGKNEKKIIEMNIDTGIR